MTSIKKKLHLLWISLIIFIQTSTIINQVLTKFENFEISYELFSSEQQSKQQKEITIQPDVDSIMIKISANHTGWLSLGFGTIWSKKDLIILYYSDEGIPMVEDRYTPNMKSPIIDDKQNVFIQKEECLRTNNSTTFSFFRKLNTGDDEQDIPILLDQEQMIFFAWGENDHFTKYKNYNAEQFIFKSKKNSQIIKNNVQDTIYNNDKKYRITQTPQCDNIDQIKVNGQCIYNDIALPEQKIEISPGIFVYWQVSTINQTVDFVFKYNFRGWFGIGLTQTMFVNDIHIANIIENGTNIQLIDTYSKIETSPTVDSQQDLKLKGFKISNEETIIKYSRLLKTNDTTQDIELTNGGKYQFSAAWSKKFDALKYHGHLKTTFNIILQNIVKQPCINDTVFVNNTCQQNDIAEPKFQQQINSDINLFWEFNNDTIDFMFKYNFRGWIGLCLRPVMINSDIHIAEIYEPEIRVLDYWATRYSKPSLDTQQDLKVKGYLLAKNQTIIKYSRKLNTTDSLDTPLERNQNYQFSVSYALTDKVRYHGPTIIIFDTFLTDGTIIIKNCSSMEILINSECVFNNLTEPINSMQILKGINFFWQFTNNNSKIEIMLKYNFRGWLGLGFSQNMSQCDMNIIQINSNKDNNNLSVSLLDCFAIGHQLPSVDKNQNLQLLGYNATDNQTVVKYARLLDTNDTEEDRLLVLGEEYTFCTAYSTQDDKLQFHGPNFAVFKVKLVENIAIIKECPDGEFLQSDNCVVNNITELKNFTQIIDGVQLFWEFQQNDSILFMLKYNFHGWFGFGLGSSMSNTDMHIIEVSENQVFIQDSYSLNHSLPSADSQQDLKLKGYKVQPNETIVKYQRNLTTNDSQDQTLIKGQQYTFCYAYTKDEKIRFHGLSNYGLFQIVLTDINIQNQNNNNNNNNYLIDTYSSLKIMDGVFLYWKFQDNDESINFLIEYNFHGWFGLGLGPSMTQNDMHIIQLTQTASNAFKIELLDAWSSGQTAPEIDQEQSLTLLDYGLANENVIHVLYNRKLITNDYQDKPLKKGEYYTFCFAYHKSNDKLSYHAENKAAFKLKLDENFHGEANLINTSSSALSYHKLLLFWGWGFLADISIIFTRFFRRWRYYIAIHFALFIILDIATIVLAVVMILENQTKLSNLSNLMENVKIHYIFGILFIGFMVVQHFSGMALNMFIQTKKFNNRISKSKIFHFVIGYLVYFYSKFQIIDGKLLEEGDNQLQILIVTVGPFFLRLTCEIIYKLKPSFLIIERDTDNVNKKLINMYNKGVSIRKIFSEFPNIKFCMLNGRLYDTSQFLHPGGNFIIEEMNGHEIDCYMYGGYFYEKTLNKRAYEHSFYAFNMIEKYYIGTPDTSKLNFLVRKKNTANIKIWQCAKSHTIAPQIKLVQFKSTRHKILNYMSGIAWMGSHFSIFSPDIQKKRLYTTVISMNEVNVELRKQMVQYALNNCEGNIDFTKIQTQNDYLHFIVKNYHSSNSEASLSSYLHYNSSSQFVIEGPFGIGLQLQNYSSGTCLVFAGGTGILPFLDLLDFLLKQIIYKITVQLKGEEEAKLKVDPLNLGYGTELQGIKIFFYVSFVSLSQVIGKDIIQPLLQLNQQYNHILDIDFCVRFSQKGQKMLNCRNQEGYFNEQFIYSQQKLWGKCDRAYVCGTPDFIRTIPKYLQKIGLDPYKIFIP